MSERCSQLTKTGAPCRNRAQHGSDRCAAHALADDALTAELVEQLVVVLRAGNYLSVALRAVGLDEATYQTWMTRGQSQAVRDALYRDFRDRVEQACAEGEVRAVTQIARAAVDSWQAAAWLLERQYPDRWARPAQRQDELPLPLPAGRDFVDELERKRAMRRGEDEL